jgi:hypothetical protein
MTLMQVITVMAWLTSTRCRIKYARGDGMPCSRTAKRESDGQERSERREAGC